MTATTALSLKCLVAGVPYKAKVSILDPVTGAPITGITQVRGVFIDTIDTSQPVIEVTSPVTFAGDGDGIYKGIIPATETAKFLQDPADANSPLIYTSVYLNLHIDRVDPDGDAVAHVLCSKPQKVDRAPLAN